MNIEDKQAILEDFLQRWPRSVVQDMQLSEYVGIHNKDTFTYWVETKTRPLGSIKGSYSDKFGIYRRIDAAKQPKNRNSDNEYTWLYRYGDSRDQAFQSIKQILLQIIDYADKGEFAAIDWLPLSHMFKWKVASLYSNERLVPIFRYETVLAIAGAYGLPNNPQPTVSQVQELLIAKKPADQDVYAYMETLYDRYGRKDSQEADQVPVQSFVKNQPRRRASLSKSTTPQVRNGAQSYIAVLKHNKIQEALYRRLITQHGEGAVRLEEDWVDIKVVLPAEIILYEVKAAAYASECVRQALGQLVGYLFNNKDSRAKKLVVVGQYLPNESDRQFIDFVSSVLKVEFTYENIALDGSSN